MTSFQRKLGQYKKLLTEAGESDPVAAYIMRVLDLHEKRFIRKPVKRPDNKLTNQRRSKYNLHLLKVGDTKEFSGVKLKSMRDAVRRVGRNNNMVLTLSHNGGDRCYVTRVS